MFGTVARLRLKPGMEERMMELMREYEDVGIPGHRGEHVYRVDDDTNEYIMAVMFDSKEDYEANAASPEQHERYLKYRELLDGDPEWNDGEIVYSQMR